MKRRAFLINSTVVLLLIPLMLLLATYEDVSSQIVGAQSERTQVERTYRVVSYVEMDFQKALEISGKRAVVAAIDYVSTTGNFLTYRPANETIKDLTLRATSPQLSSYENLQRIMQNQSIERWLDLIGEKLREQGYRLSPGADEIANNMNITVAPLDSFRIVIKARITNITISDTSGRVVYTGPIPRSGYAYSIVDIRDLEDPIFSAMTGGRYQRSIRACTYPFPELIDKPVKVLYGTGKSNEGHVVGTYSSQLDPNGIFIGETYPDDEEAKAYAYVLEEGSIDSADRIIVNTTMEGTPVNPAEIFKDGDRGVLVFSGASSGGGEWCSSLGHRLNITVRNNLNVDLTDYQIPILLSTAKGFTQDQLNEIFGNTATAGSDPYETNASIAIYNSSCNPVPFWIEYWDSNNKEALIWIRASIPANGNLRIGLYFGDELPPTKGDGSEVFEYFNDFKGEFTLNGGDEVEHPLAQDLDVSKGFAVRFRMMSNRQNPRDWDGGIGIEDDDGRMLLFTDDSTRGGDGLAIHYAWWNNESNVDGRSPANTYHVYEALMKPYSSSSKDSRFKDITDGGVNDDSYFRFWSEPLRKLYLVTDSEKNKRETIYDWIAIRKYPDDSDRLEDPNFNGISYPNVNQNDPETKPTPSSSAGPSRAYDLQPFVDCLMDQRYFGTYDGWSLFERLEGSSKNHDEYFELAKRMQDELGVKYGDRYYPIGLVSFMIPHASYDEKLFNLFNSLGIAVEEGQSSVDYYFLSYYFRRGSKVEGYRVWGISYGITSTGDLSSIPFFLDEETAEAIFGEVEAEDLLKR
ncbi:DNA-binding protein [Thermococcus sp. P6]|uniref:DUF2341 domain-containing protein n=1 Tax=Thermococcus sp. P6 TaxID=122420 RepID=UPI000B59E0EE|nr:DUF2341 domain-containing protein [Thermococcus sp. P6]ASJ10374.1 DNA-binding protein [Thermococcus sp. P6]